MKAITLNDIIKTTHYGNERYYRAEDVDKLVEAARKYLNAEENYSAVETTTNFMFLARRRDVFKAALATWEQPGNTGEGES